jgi:hypothetical protein
MCLLLSCVTGMHYINSWTFLYSSSELTVRILSFLKNDGVLHIVLTLIQIQW